MALQRVQHAQARDIRPYGAAIREAKPVVAPRAVDASSVLVTIVL